MHERRRVKAWTDPIRSQGDGRVIPIRRGLERGFEAVVDRNRGDGDI